MVGALPDKPTQEGTMCNGEALAAAVVAVAEGEPNRPVLLAPSLWVRSSYIVLALCPEVLERAAAAAAQEDRPKLGLIQPQSIRHDHEVVA
jgi:hypothetical protein